MERTNDSILEQQSLSDVVKLEPFIANEVNLRLDLWRVDREMNRQRLDNYVPTKVSREALKGMLEGTSASTTDRIHFLTGSYGTGKSYLLLVLANLLGRDLGEEHVETLIRRIEKEEGRYQDELGDAIKRARTTGKHLVVVPHYAEQNFRRALLDGLRRALEQEDIDYRPKTEYEHASNLIEHWIQNDNPVLGEIRKRAQEDGTSLEKLEAEIKEDYEEEALSKIDGYYEEAMGVGLPYENINIEDTYKDTEKYIRRECDYRGICILFDEFGHFLKKFVNRPDAADGLIIQNFIEFINKAPSANIMMVMAAHRSVADYARGNVSRKDIEKVSGRFDKKHRLRVSSEFDEAEEMIFKTVVSSGKKNETIKLVKEKLEKKYKSEWSDHLSDWYYDRPEDWRRETIAKGCYPLHPATVRVLPQVSDRMGQSTRTMFRYMSPEEEGGVSSFIRGNKVLNNEGHLKLLTIDKLYDYFLSAVDVPDSNQLDAAQIKRRYRRARANIQVDDPLVQRLLKALAVLRVITDKELQSTAENLAWTLNLGPERAEKVHELLEILSAQGAVRKNPATGIYKFRGAGEVPVRHIHQEYLRETEGLSPAEEKDIYSKVYGIKNDKIEPIRYNDEYYTNRKAVQDYVIGGKHDVTIESWKNNLKRVYENGDGNEYEGNIVVLRALAKNKAEKDSIKSNYREISDELKRYFIVGATVVPTGLAEAARNYDAARQTVKDERVQKNEDTKEEAKHLVREYRDALEKELENILRPKNFEWYYKGESKFNEGELDKKGLIKFVSDIFENLFYRTPKISYDIIQHYTENRDSHKKARREAMNLFLDQGKNAFAFHGSSKKKNMIERLVKPNQMYEVHSKKKNRTYFSLKKPPEDTTARYVWDILEDNLCREGQEARLSSAVQTLYHAPYGLSHPAVEMFLGAFVGFHSEEFRLLRGRRTTTLNGENLGSARANPDKFSLRYHFLTPTQKRYLRDLRSQFGAEGESSAGLWKDTADAMLGWYEKLPTLTKNFVQEDSSVERLFKALRKYGDSDRNQQKAAKAMLSRHLPENFGLNPDDIEKKSEKDSLLEKVIRAKESAEAFESNYADEILEDLAYRAFEESCTGSRQFREIVDGWLDEVSVATRQHFKKKGDRAGYFLQTAGKQGDIVEVFLEEIPAAWEGLSPYRKWSEQQELRKYIDTVTDVVRRIQDHRASPVPLLNRISHEAFDREIESEEEFEEVVIGWFEGLEPEKSQKLRKGGFSTEARALCNAIEKVKRAEGSPVDHFLQYLPENLDIVGGGWPNLPQPAANDLVFTVAEAVEEVRTWKPPLSTQKLVEEILWDLSGDIWELEVVDDPEEKLEEKSQEWYDALPPAIELEEFDGIEGEILRTIRSGQQSIREALETEVPDMIGVAPPSEAESAEDGEEVVRRVKKAFREIDRWERPVEDLIRSLDGDGHFFDGANNTSDVALRVINWWRDLEQKPQSPSEFEDDPMARQLVRWGREHLEWKEVFPDLVRAADLPRNFQYWGDQEDKAFAVALDKAQKRVENWEPPKPSEEEVRERIRDAFDEIAESMNVEVSELMSVVRQMVQE